MHCRHWLIARQNFQVSQSWALSCLAWITVRKQDVQYPKANKIIAVFCSQFYRPIFPVAKSYYVLISILCWINHLPIQLTLYPYKQPKLKFNDVLQIINTMQISQSFCVTKASEKGIWQPLVFSNLISKWHPLLDES